MAQGRDPEAASAEPLMLSARFLPLFITQLLGALNDNLFKNALVVYAIFHAGGAGPLLVAAAGGVFIAPYALFSATAGQLADRYDKSRLIRATKLWEVGLMLASAVGFLTGSIGWLMAVLFGLGVQATFFGPLKYGILPDHLRREEIVAGNARIEAGTFVGILVGTIAGGLLILPRSGRVAVAVAGIVVAVLGVAAAFRVPRAPAAAPELRIGWNIARETWALLRRARANPPVWRAMLGLSWFWTLGATFLAEFPVLAEHDFAAQGAVITLLLTMFALGVGAGSMLVSRLLAGEISARYAPVAAAALSLFAADFAWVCLGIGPAAGWHTVGAMLEKPMAWRALADLFLVAACGGAFSVPLYAIMQERSATALRARMIAANNVLNAAGMVAGAGVLAALAAAGLGAPAILLIAAGLNAVVAFGAWQVVRQDRVRDALAASGNEASE
ncbi:MAG: MFS transporter [Alphaproteobacteria bacterium]|nr:MFS transporter [Alphaproteobacteria bacterium]